MEVTEPLGSEILLHASTQPEAGAETIAVDERPDTFVARVDPRAQVSAGSIVPLSFNMARMHVFDPQTEAALV